MVRDETTWGSPNPPAAFYRYSPDRKGEHAQALLASVSGFLHADAYAGFDKLYQPDPITGRPRLEPVACWAHARRELFDEHARTKSQLRHGLAAKVPAATLEGEVEIDEVYVVAGHKGQPAAVAKRGVLDGVGAWQERRAAARWKRTSHRSWA